MQTCLELPPCHPRAGRGPPSPPAPCHELGLRLRVRETVVVGNTNRCVASSPALVGTTASQFPINHPPPSPGIKAQRAAGPRLTSRREGAFAGSPAEPPPEYLRHKAPRTNADAPTRGQVRPCIGQAIRRVCIHCAPMHPTCTHHSRPGPDPGPLSAPKTPAQGRGVACHSPPGPGKRAGALSPKDPGSRPGRCPPLGPRPRQACRGVCR